MPVDGMRAFLGLMKIVAGGRVVAAGIDGLREAAGNSRDGFGAGGSSDRPVLKLHSAPSIQERIAYIRKMGNKGKIDPEVYEFTRKALTKKCGVGGDGRTNWCTEEKDYDAEVTAIFNAVRDEVRYTHDIRGIDTYQHPKRTLQFHGGDCDDSSSLLAAMLMSAGYEVRGRIIRTNDAEDWNHIFVIVKVPTGNDSSKWCALDASVRKPAGWYPPDSMVAQKADFAFD